MFFRLATLGCKVNQYETQLVREGLRRLGYVEAVGDDVADLLLVNTCTVTAESDMKSRKIARKMLKNNPGAELIVMGCSATQNPDAWHEIDGVSRIITDKQRIPEFLQEIGLSAPLNGISGFGERHRAYVKVQDGCRVGCSYCIIPKVRPTLKSRSEKSILEEIRRLSQNGYREIVLTGIHLGHYGLDFDEPVRDLAQYTREYRSQKRHLPELIRKIVDLPEPFRLRISSLEAVEVDNDLVDLMLRYPDRICPHLHLSMQSGNDDVLRRMRRRWLREPFVRRCEEILARFDRLALTTDVIVGFPGETEHQFDETCQTVEQLGFSKVHVFRFSPRDGTEAARLPDRIAPTVQKHRADRLIRIADRLRKNYAASLVGMTLPVLLENSSGGTVDRYLDLRLKKPSLSDQVGRIVNVFVTQAEGDVLIGKLHSNLQRMTD